MSYKKFSQKITTIPGRKCYKIQLYRYKAYLIRLFEVIYNWKKCFSEMADPR